MIVDHLVSYAILALSCAWIVFLVIVSLAAVLNNR